MFKVYRERHFLLFFGHFISLVTRYWLNAIVCVSFEDLQIFYKTAILFFDYFN